MEYSIVITDPAFDDLAGIKHHFDHILKSPGVGRKLLAEIMDAIRSLESMPMRHTISDQWLAYAGVRAMPVKSYMVFYTIEEKTVLILSVMHSSRNWINLV